MSDGRKRFSGSHYRKKAKEKEEKVQQVLAKVRKIDEIYKPKPQASTSKSRNAEQGGKF